MNFKTILSPMQGVTDLPFRRLCRELSGGGARFVSEFLSTDGSTFLTKINLRALRFDNEEKPFCVQLFGIFPQKLADAAVQVEEFGADFIELNAGCPVPKVARKGGGAGLLLNLPNLKNILKTMKAAVKVPLFLKCRIGWDENSICIDEVLKIAEGEGVSQLTIHGRTRVQGYKGLANWNIIGEIASKAKIPVIGNGDINSVESALRAVQSYGVAGVAIGRGALHNPWLLGEIACEQRRKISVKEVCSAVLRYAELMREDGLNEGQTLGKLKQFSARLCKSFEPSVSEFRLQLLRTNNYEEFLQIWLKFRDVCDTSQIRFNPDRLQNLNGQTIDELEFGKQFR
ncbi:tRNA-dihydrouridine synthase [Fibrobacterales bacterium]|nr:tRNA-dihydrouridine synthase [Fibrobacterales bacterium]